MENVTLKCNACQIPTCVVSASISDISKCTAQLSFCAYACGISHNGGISTRTGNKHIKFSYNPMLILVHISPCQFPQVT